MEKTLAIAANTFREAIRDRVLYLLLAFALLMIGSSILLSLLTVGSREKIIIDLGLSAISIFGVLTSIFLGVGLVFKEIDRRTIYTIVTKPVQRAQFILGKYLGLCLTLGVNLAVMTAGFYLLLAWEGCAYARLLPAILLTLFELLVVTALALLFSSFSTPILSALFTLSCFLVGRLSWSLRLLEEKIASAWGKGVCEAFYWVLPNLERFNLRTEAVHGLALETGEVAFAMAYGIGYAALLVAAACLAFERRDFV
jgi:ABC-type transport system involved in multi-copper enzyme maturation permease subunit